MLRAASLHSRCTALIFAPESTDAPGFDDLGRLTPDYWPARTPIIDDAQLRIVGAPREQAHAALEACRRLRDLPAGQITVASAIPPWPRAWNARSSRAIASPNAKSPRASRPPGRLPSCKPWPISTATAPPRNGPP